MALLSGLIAKEAVVSSMSLFYGFSLSASGAVVASALSGTFQTPVAAYAFLVFVLLYVPLSLIHIWAPLRVKSSGVRFRTLASRGRYSPWFSSV